MLALRWPWGLPERAAVCSGREEQRCGRAGGMGRGPAGSVPVTLRTRPPQPSGTVQGLKLPACVAARVQGGQIALGGRGAGGVQEREREGSLNTRRGPAQGRLRVQPRAPPGVPPGALSAWGQGRSEVSAEPWGTAGPPHRRAWMSEARWPLASLACSWRPAAPRKPSRTPGPCELLSLAPNHPIPLFMSRSQDQKRAPGPAGRAWGETWAEFRKLRKEAAGLG